ncbi:MAG TPA: hypothetical protein VFW44_05775 [Bryobacteraceae bacterium]|nr:hypothetical protein [Bryobacteraceae bacterium]
MVHVQMVLLWMFVIFDGIAIGGGLYEVRAVYPNWKKDPRPETLAQRLRESSQVSAGRRFWPFVSPLLSLLSFLNIWAAFEATGNLRMVWLGAAIAVAIRSIAGYAYFVPTILRIEKPEAMAQAELERTVQRWTFWSPWRLYLEFPAWIAALWVLTAFHPR